MRTSQAAERAGVNFQTLRYYERRGILPPPQRQESGYGAYGADSVQAVRFIKRAQELGFTLAEVETLLELAAGGPENCDATRQMAVQKISRLDQKIANLRAMRESLRRLMTTCQLPRSERECPLIQSLATGNRRPRVRR